MLFEISVSQEITVSNIYITPKKIFLTDAIISELHYYGHIYMTCLLFFKEKLKITIPNLRLR